MRKHLLKADHSTQGIGSISGLRGEKSARGLSPGFTLIELMIAMVVVGILTAVAISSYRSSVLKSHRGAAASALLDLASREEKWYSLNNSYAVTASSLGFASGFPINAPLSGTAAYTINAPTVVAANPTASPPTPATFTITAVPTTSQAQDTCGSFTINSVGQQTVTGTTAAATCW